MKRILIVDDDQGREVIAEIIRGWGEYDVRTADDGAVALDLMTQSPPDLLILDIVMPRMHGFAVLSELKKRNALGLMKVIVLSGKEYEADREKALSLGANAYLVKPVVPEILRQKIMQLLPDAASSGTTLRFWGTRGSIPTPGSAYQKYGGNTPCIELRMGSDIIVFDAGSGIRELGIALASEFAGRPVTVHLFISHTHWDHIQGFPFFEVCYMPSANIKIYGPPGADCGLEHIFTMLHDPNFFPVSLEKMKAKMTFRDIRDESVHINDIKVTCRYLNHPGLVYGYRVDFGSTSIVYMTDNEPQHMPDASYAFDSSLAEFISGASLLVADAQYFDNEFLQKAGWGHSSWSHAFRLALEGGAKRLILFHHDPRHTDDQLDRAVAEAEKKPEYGGRISFAAAEEGMKLTF